MKQKLIFPLFVLVSVLLRHCNVYPWLCDLYLVNVAVVVGIFEIWRGRQDKVQGVSMGREKVVCPKECEVARSRNTRKGQHWTHLGLSYSQENKVYKASSDLNGSDVKCTQRHYPDETPPVAVGKPITNLKPAQTGPKMNKPDNVNKPGMKRIGNIMNRPPRNKETAAPKNEQAPRMNNAEMKRPNPVSRRPKPLIDPKDEDPQRKKQRLAKIRAEEALRDRLKARAFSNRK